MWEMSWKWTDRDGRPTESWDASMQIANTTATSECTGGGGDGVVVGSFPLQSNTVHGM